MGDLVVSQEIDSLVRLAIEKDFDISRLEKLIEMKNAQEARQAKNDFEIHFSQMQAAFVPAKRVKSGFGYKYAPLEELQRVYGPIIADHGFSYRHREEGLENGGKRSIMTISGWGHSIDVFFDIPKIDPTKSMNAIQLMGAMSTYGRRYTFLSGFGCIVEDEDSDGVDPNKNETGPSPEEKEKKRLEKEKEEEFNQLYSIVIDHVTTYVKLKDDPTGWSKESRDALDLTKTIQEAKKKKDSSALEILDAKIAYLHPFEGNPEWKEALERVNGCKNDLAALRALLTPVPPKAEDAEFTVQEFPQDVTQKDLF